MPAVTLQDAHGGSVDLAALSQSKPYCVLYFYPKDDTPGCTQEACDFRDASAQIQHKNAVVVGVSPDSVEDHKKFYEKYTLNFPLLADPERKLIEALGVWQNKSFMGKEYMGVVRSTFLIHNGKIVKVWQPVTVANHAQDVLSQIK